jgi:large subunit ribosomal protein L36e
LIREVIRSVVGYAPYELRLRELLKTGTSTDSKKALRLAKRKLGGH